jgi:hypothetical protein
VFTADWVPSPSNRTACYGRWIQSTDGGCKRVVTDRLGEDTGAHCGALVRPTPIWSRSVLLGGSCLSFRARKLRSGRHHCPTLVRGTRMSMPVSPSKLKSPPHPHRSRLSRGWRRRTSGEMPRARSGRRPCTSKHLECLVTFVRNCAGNSNDQGAGRALPHWRRLVAQCPFTPSLVWPRERRRDRCKCPAPSEALAVDAL